MASAHRGAGRSGAPFSRVLIVSAMISAPYITPTGVLNQSLENEDVSPMTTILPATQSRSSRMLSSPWNEMSRNSFALMPASSWIK